MILSPYHQPGVLSGALGPPYSGPSVDLDRSFGFLVNDVARLFGRRFDQNGRRLGLTRAQCRAIGYLARNEGINQAGLADILEIRPMTLVRQLDRMEEAGWIERRPDPTDRRARRLFLTGKGHRVLSRIWSVADETRDEALARFSAADAEQLIEMLRRVHATLAERVPPPAAEPEPEPEPEPPWAPARGPRREPAVPVTEGSR